MRPAQRYGVVQAETASKERLMVMLFEAALRHMRTGAQALEQGRATDAVTPLTKASDIVIELHATLDARHAPELAANLARLYAFVSQQLLRASLSKDAVAAREAERVFAPVADAFAQAVHSGSRP